MKDIPESVADYFAEDSPLSDYLPDFEYRQEQAQMACFIEEALAEKKIGVVEAGTGTGKTLAYLIPAIMHACLNEETIAISTETKALQKQLIDKDIPVIRNFFSKYLGIDFSYELCLGSGNYICMKRFETALKKGIISPGPVQEQIQSLISLGEVFTRYDIQGGIHYWNEINREPDGCRGSNCLFFRKCVYQRARRRWQSAHVLVMNHHLFFTDISTGRTLLPAVSSVIFDEAHSLESVACQCLGFTLDYKYLTELCSRLSGPKKSQSLTRYVTDDETNQEISALNSDIIKEAAVFYEKIKRLMPSGKQTLRITEKTDSLSSRLVSLLKQLIMLLEQCSDSITDEDACMAMDVLRGRLNAFTDCLVEFSHIANSLSVYWLELPPGHITAVPTLKSEPILIGPRMKKDVFPGFNSALFVSATIAINGDFSFFKDSLGIEKAKNCLLTSCFSYDTQMAAFIPDKLPEPDSTEFLAHTAETCAAIIEELCGRCLILCTSYAFLRKLTEKLKELIDFPIFSQCDMYPSEALNLYTKESGGVLLGTNSFWQGIDLPGDLLKGLIITRLPFSVPDHPAIQARIEYIRSSGENPFSRLQLPEAILRFKQGSGRLIRSRKDKGILALLDNRVLTRSYGSLFLQSIPTSARFNELRPLFNAYNAMKES